MENPKVLYVSQEVTPFLPENKLSKISRNIPQGIKERGKEIRVFTPRYGKINERRHQLHEVIRLSGMNLIINDADHPLIIKVASIPSARMQVYFIDSEEYFHRKAVNRDENGEFFSDNDERAIFFSKGVLETIKKLGWTPDIIHCHGWMAGLMPAFVKELYNDDPHFSGSRIVYSIYGDGGAEELDGKVADKLKMEGFQDRTTHPFQGPNYRDIHRSAIQYSDAVIQADEEIDETIKGELNDLEKPFLGPCAEEERVEAYNELYDKVLDEKKVLAE